MRNKLLTVILLFTTLPLVAQKSVDKGIMRKDANRGAYFYGTIVKEIQERNTKEAKPGRGSFQMDQSGLDLPNDPALYEKVWYPNPESQGVTGACWSFASASHYESEIYRMHGKKVELSEVYISYCEFLLKAKGFVDSRGKSVFSSGSMANAVVRVMNEFGAMPQSAYSGKPHGGRFHSHTAMNREMEAYLYSLRESNAWNEKIVLETIKCIMDRYIGTPPERFEVDGKEYTPKSYLSDYLKFDPNDMVDFMSFKKYPFWEQSEFVTGDNWWHSDKYYNVPLSEFMGAIKKSITMGYSVRLGGDFSECGFNYETNCAMIPDFDIPSDYISDDARQFRLSNGATTDDHGFHLIGILENYKGSGKDWYLVKDSSASSRNVGEDDDKFGLFFFHEDYIRLKMCLITLHRDVVEDLIKQFN